MNTLEFLQALHGQSDLFTTVARKGEQLTFQWHTTEDIPRVAKALERQANQADLYVSAAGFKSQPQRGRGTLGDVGSIAGLWADIDIGTVGHKPAALPNPGSVEEAMKIIDGLPEPSVIIHSGGGLQVWWLFEEPWRFDDPTEAQRASNAFQERLQAKAKSLGYHVDSVGDLPRILRAPGTMNHKETEPRPVRVLEASGKRYPAAELVAVTELASNEPGGLGNWAEILEPHGWTFAGTRLGDGAGQWVRPGKSKSEGISAVTDPFGAPVLVNFSGSANLPVGPGHRLTKFKVWALLNHEGDLDRAREAIERTQRRDPASIRQQAQRFTQLDWSKVFTLSEDPVDWLVEPLIETGTQVAIYSEAKAGKSLLALEIAARLAAGWEQFTWPPAKDRPKHSVVYVDMENRPYNIGERLIKMGFQPEDLDNLHFYSFPNLRYLDTKQGAEELLAIALDNAADVVIIDTLSRVVEGAENDNDTYNRFFEHTGMALKAEGIALVRLDHCGKVAAKGMRGASAKTTDVDAVWELSVSGPADMVALRRTHDRNAHGYGYLELVRHDDPVLHHARESADTSLFDVDAPHRTMTLRQRIEGILERADAPSVELDLSDIVDCLRAENEPASEHVIKNTLSKMASDPKCPVERVKRGRYGLRRRNQGDFEMTSTPSAA